MTKMIFCLRWMAAPLPNVHLTFNATPHKDGRWPITVLYKKWEDVYRIILDEAEDL